MKLRNEVVQQCLYRSIESKSPSWLGTAVKIAARAHRPWRACGSGRAPRRVDDTSCSSATRAAAALSWWWCVCTLCVPRDAGVSPPVVEPGRPPRLFSPLPPSAVCHHCDARTRVRYFAGGASHRAVVQRLFPAVLPFSRLSLSPSPGRPFIPPARTGPSCLLAKLPAPLYPLNPPRPSPSFPPRSRVLLVGASPLAPAPPWNPLPASRRLPLPWARSPPLLRRPCRRHRCRRLPPQPPLPLLQQLRLAPIPPLPSARGWAPCRPWRRRPSTRCGR